MKNSLRIFKLGIAGQLISAMSILMIVMIFVISFINIQNEQAVILKKSLAHVHAITSLLNESSINYLDEFNVGKLRLLLSDVTGNPDIVYSYIFDEEGLIITDGTDENPLRDEKLLDAISLRSIAALTTLEQFDQGIVDVTSPIYLGEKKLGGVRIGYSLASIEQEKQQVIYKNIQLSFIFLFIMILVVYLIAKRITQPLKSFTTAIVNFDVNDKKQITQIQRKDEIGELYQAFNNLIYNLKLTTASKEQLDEEIINRKEIELDLRESIKKANIAVESKRAFLANMSHEIRTPMNGVLGMLGLLLTGNLDEEQKHRVVIAKSSADTLLTIINDILDFSKVEAGKLHLEHVEFDVRTLIEHCIVSMALQAQEKNIELILDLSMIKHSMIKSDPNRLRQILTNIVGNAIKFTEKGEIIIYVELVDTKNSEKGLTTQLYCKIKDTGIGIEKEQQTLLFETFSQVDSSTTRKYGGTGLGLTISRKLCQLMGGDIHVTSKKGKGSCFEFNLIIEKSNPLTSVAPDINLSRLQILIVDENATTRKVLQRQLSIWGAKTVEADSYETALLLCNDRVNSKVLTLFDIALIDMKMTNIDGETLAKNIRSNKNYNAMKLVLMSSMAEIGDVKHLSELEYTAYFPKPIATYDLFNALALNSDDGEALKPMPPISTKSNTLINDQETKKQAVLSYPPLAEGNDTKDCWPENMRVLLVEDNRINQMVALSVLKNIGIIADVAVNGIEALKCLKEATSVKPYTLVIMDCQMPEMDGYEATKRIRANEAGVENSLIPIIAMTANAMEGDKEKCLDAGMDDYLSKPIEPEIVYEKLKLWVNK
ncbi:MAG: response regulator [Colwellia sp.]|nr:response regulator [Colwellia sp.]